MTRSLERPELEKRPLNPSLSMRENKLIHSFEMKRKDWEKIIKKKNNLLRDRELNIHKRLALGKIEADERDIPLIKSRS